MADVYATQWVGIADGTVIPANKADGGQINAKVSSITASKPAGTALASGDRLFLGRLRQGDRIKQILVTTDTSFATSTLSIGTTGTPAKYVNAATNTTVDKPQPIGPKASTLSTGVLTADEDIWLTVGVATIASATVATFEIEITSVK